MSSERFARTHLYDGFISYSHAADDLLAPRLQSGLQRFAKPWWRRRAVRMFRDDASLAANPHLWSSIVEALDSSEWFVLLLSEDAASSEWVTREIEHWLANKDSGRILPVVTSGTFGWSDGDVEGSSVPSALRGVFSEEPRWVDLRFAKGDELLDLQNPDFSAAVADISAAIRGVPKDELASEEVRQHRRTIRTAWAAGMVVAILGVAAAVFGVQSATNARIAEENAQAEAEARQEAEANAELASRSEAEARENERIALEKEAEARTFYEFALREAQSEKASDIVRHATLAADDGDHELAVALVLYAVGVVGDDLDIIRGEAEAVLLKSLPEYRSTTTDPDNFLSSVSPDGALFFVFEDPEDEGAELVARDTAGYEEVWRYPLGRDASPTTATVRPGGDQVVVPVQGGGQEWRFVVLTAQGALVAEVLMGECRDQDGFGPGWFSPDGKYYALPTGSADCETSADESWAVVYETETWTEFTRIHSTPDTDSDHPAPGAADSVQFADGSSFVLVHGRGALVQLRSFPDLELIHSFGSGVQNVAISPLGDRLVIQRAGFGPVLVDAQTGAPLSGLRAGGDFNEATGTALSFSPDGKKVAVFTSELTYVFRAEDGERLFSLHHGSERPRPSWTADGNTLLFGGTSWNVGDQPENLQPLPLLSLGFEELIDLARSVIVHGISLEECFKYGVERAVGSDTFCPTVADLQGD